MTQPDRNRPADSEVPHLTEPEFSRRFSALLPALRGYVLSILPHPDVVDDVLQETSIFLWENRKSFRPGTSFKAWAFKAAYFKALSQRRDLQRRRVVTLSEDMLHRIAGASEDRAQMAEDKFRALRFCLEKLRAEDFELLKLKYIEGKSLADEARATGVPPNRLQKALSRVRLALRQCVNQKLSTKE